MHCNFLFKSSENQWFLILVGDVSITKTVMELYKYGFKSQERQYEGANSNKLNPLLELVPFGLTAEEDSYTLQLSEIQPCEVPLETLPANDWMIASYPSNHLKWQHFDIEKLSTREKKDFLKACEERGLILT